MKYLETCGNKSLDKIQLGVFYGDMTLQYISLMAIHSVIYITFYMLAWQNCLSFLIYEGIKTDCPSKNL